MKVVGKVLLRQLLGQRAFTFDNWVFLQKITVTGERSFMERFADKAEFNEI